MILTETDILDAFYKHITSTELKNLINGSCFRTPRPINSAEEDLVISVLATGAGQIQPFTLNVNIYVPNIRRGQESILNEERIAFLMRESLKVFERGRISYYYNEKCYDIIYSLESQKIYQAKETDFHAINHRLNVRVSTES